MNGKPDLVIVGQVTIDDVVPAEAGAWRRQMGGSAVYAAAGARLWLEPERIGFVARIGVDYPFDAEALLREAGVRHIALRRIGEEHLVEWLIYEPDGSRRSLPRNPSLLETGAEGGKTSVEALEAYRAKLLAIAPTAADVPPEWFPTAALHLCTQVGERHRETLDAVSDRVAWISVDPSPHYSRNASSTALARRLRGTTALCPSVNEVRGLLTAASADSAVLDLHRAGFAEVALKRGADAVLLAHAGTVNSIATTAVAVVDPTGAGDAFCGAYAACRLIGLSPLDAARRAVGSAALVVGCSGVEAALSLRQPAIHALR